MSVRYHALPRNLFEAVAAGGGGPQAVRALAAAEHSKHVILMLGVLEAAQGADAEQARYARLGHEVLVEVERHDPRGAAWVTSYPAVGAWAVRTMRALRADNGASAAQPARLAAVAAAAAIRSGLDAEVPVLPDAGVVSLPSLGSVRVDADSAVVRSRAGRAEVRWAHGRVEVRRDSGQDGPGWQDLRSCRAGDLNVLIDDLDPFRMPSLVGFAPRLSAHRVGEWENALQQGWRVLAAGHPAIAADAAVAISVIVPLDRSAHGGRSSSSSEAFGAVAMSRPADPCTCAVTVTHELQHLKLCALQEHRQPNPARRWPPVLRAVAN